MDFTLRSVSAADYAWLWALKRLTMRNYVEQTWGFWDEKVQEDFFRRGFDPAVVKIIVADGRAAGRLHVERHAGEFFLGDIEVHPDFQNRGLGTAVLRALQTEACDCGVPIRLQVLKVNPARHLYLRLGFSDFTKTTTHFHMKWLPR